MNSSFLTNLRQFFGRLSIGQRVGIGAVVLAAAALLGGITYWSGRPDYTLLFAKLAPSDASQIVEVLKEENVPYELKENGTSVYVPQDKVYDLRLRLTGEGLVSDGLAGYELFDRNTLGMTDFMQKLNLKRALEGELARTVSNIRQVEMARVHLVIPERSPFREAQVQPTASVVIQLKGGGLDRGQIEAITALVAGAVEGLSPTNVTVLDTRGNMLSNPDAADPEALASNSQIKLQRTLETHLTEKGQSMLDQVLGPGNALVRVTATLDFTRTVQERDLVDPESQTVISEEERTEDGTESTSNSTLKNYEVSRTRERSEKQLGEISFLTVSVIVNYKQDEAAPVQPAAEGADGDAAPAFVPYTDEEIANIESIVKNAVGFADERGDRFAIHQTKFDTSVDLQAEQIIQEERQAERTQLYLRYGLMALGILAALWLVRSATRAVASTVAAAPPALPAPEEETPLALTASPMAPAPAPDVNADGDRYLPSAAGGAGPDTVAAMLQGADMYASKLTPEARARLKAKNELFEVVKRTASEAPEATADVIRSWLVEDLRAKAMA